MVFENKRVQFDSTTKKVLFNNKTKRVMFYDCGCDDCEPEPGTPACMTIEISGFSDVACYDSPVGGSKEPFGDISSNFNGVHVLLQLGHGLWGWSCCSWRKTWNAGEGVGYYQYVTDDCTGSKETKNILEFRVYYARASRQLMLMYSLGGGVFTNAYECWFNEGSDDCCCFNEGIDHYTAYLIDGGSFSGCDGNYPGGCP